MTKEELLNKKTFIDLLSIKNNIQRTEKEIELSEQAKELKCSREFNKLLSVWKSEMSNKLHLDKEIIIKDIPISGLVTEKYTCNKDGIFSDKEKVCFHPIIPVHIFRNIQNDKVKVELSYMIQEKWETVTVDKTLISIANRISALSDKGLDITSENAKEVVKYLNEVINLNVDKIPNDNSVSSVGWHGDSFIPFDKGSLFDGVDEFKDVYSAIVSKGDKSIWYNLIKELRKNQIVQILMATTFASPLLEKMNIMPFIVNIYSSKSGTGKTVACMVAMSVWGNPKSGALHFGTNNTTNFYIRVAAFLKNITMFCDELQVIKHNKFMPLDSLVMDLCNGKERGRATKDNEIQEMRTWHNNFLFTNNEKLAKSNFGEQTYNRILDIESNEQIIEHGNTVVNIITKNFGFAGKEYIKYIKKIGFDKIHDMFSEYYKKVVKETKATEKQAICISSIMVANKLSQECLFPDEKELEISDIIDFINDRDEIETWRNAYEYLLSVIATNKKKFDDKDTPTTGYGEIWGKNDEYFVTIDKEILERELKKGNFEFDSIKKQWADKNILQKNSQGRYHTLTSVNGRKANYVTINMPNERENI